MYEWLFLYASVGLIARASVSISEWCQTACSRNSHEELYYTVLYNMTMNIGFHGIIHRVANASHSYSCDKMCVCMCLSTMAYSICIW